MKTSKSQLARSLRWRRAHPEKMREIAANQYYRNREWILWKMRLSRLLEKVVIAHGDPPGY